jgi:uncharacterized Fe-S cluster-containing protein
MAATKRKKLNLNNLKTGSFTAWCKSHGFNGVTNACIQAGLKSKNATIRKRAQFASNARKWNKKKSK